MHLGIHEERPGFMLPYGLVQIGEAALFNKGRGLERTGLRETKGNLGGGGGLRKFVQVKINMHQHVNND